MFLKFSNIKIAVVYAEKIFDSRVVYSLFSSTLYDGTSSFEYYIILSCFCKKMARYGALYVVPQYVEVIACTALSSTYIILFLDYYHFVTV